MQFISSMDVVCGAKIHVYMLDFGKFLPSLIGNCALKTIHSFRPVCEHSILPNNSFAVGILRVNTAIQSYAKTVPVV